ncbi:zinc finger protein 687b-like [Ostrinia nubilalis]|uniref:zinc finger protein 687b-like n=1 Tax=Ostrinia nubilalis TaxID=29057 RepID=UPI0030826AD6
MNELADHQSKYHPLTVVLEACKYCHKEFAGVKAMEKHMERAHQRELHLYKYKCVHCDAIFKHPQKLFAHFSSTHKDIEPYTCKICDKKFKLRKRFTIHIKLDHKSIGYIEFDENYHVFFSDKKSEKPFRPIAESLTQNDDSVASEASQDAICEAQNEVEKEETAEVPSNAVEEANENINLNKDFMSATETEGNQTEVEQSEEKTQTRKRKRRTNLKNEKAESSDDEPLLEVKKRVIKLRKSKLTHATWNRKKQTELKVNKKRFICNICKKYCYTFQNYHNHVGTHYKNVTLKCVKCSKTFDSKEELNKHCSEEHSTSQLTETLKSLLEKRKKGQNPEGTTAEKFQRTIKNVDFPTDTVSVTLKPVNQNQSVKNFLESFTPEDAPKNTPSIEVVTSITMKPYVGERREPLIKMTKCNITPMDYTEKKLSMPVQFRQVFRETHKVTIKQVFPDPTPEPSQDYPETYDYESDDKNESIPEVAQEVMLEVSEEAPPKTLYIPHKIVLPNLPKEFNKVRIAHLQPEAPYYKIVKVEDVLNPQKKTKQPKPIPKPDIKLPDGTKLVTVNPLAHLLRGTPVEKILENNKSKYYQPKPKDVEMAIAKAMLKLENPNAFSKKRKKKCDVEK